MKSRITLLNRIVALILAFSFIMPVLPLEYIDWRFGFNLAKYNTFRSESKALTYTITGETVTADVTSLDQIQEYLTTANNNPNNLYVLTYKGSTAMSISSNVVLTTSGHVKIQRGEENINDYIFKVTTGGTLSIGTENMTGTIELDGGAVFTKETTMKYNFDTERKTTKNFKTVNDIQYVLFNDGEDYSVAHWYKVTGLKSTYGLVKVEDGTLNVYDNVRIGNVFGYYSDTNAGNDSKLGAINVSPKTYATSTPVLNMYGGEVSWNAMGIYDNGAGPAIYIGAKNDDYQVKAVGNIYGGSILYNVALDVAGRNSADGGAIAVDRAKLYLRGGIISNNRGGSANSGGTGANGGAISVRNNAELFMYGGEISNNSTGCLGGGVALWYSKFHMYGGLITRNYAAYGGGAGMSCKNAKVGNEYRGCEIYLYNDATISENFAEYGGGVSAGGLDRGYKAEFVMLNGNIINNEAIYEGGGICNYNYVQSNLDLRGGNISNNIAPLGAGICVRNETASVGGATDDQKMANLIHLSGGVSVNTNNEIYIKKLNSINDTEDRNGTTVNIKRYQTPIYVKARLNASGTIGMIKLDNYGNYVGVKNGVENVLDLVKFKREDGGALEVQNNKFSIDTSEYLLKEYVPESTLRLSLNDISSSTNYVVRRNDILYTRLKDAIDEANDNDTIFVINNLTIEDTITIDKNITIIPETTKTRNDSNILDGTFKNQDGVTLSNYTYQPLGDYTASLSSIFGDSSTNTAGFVVEDGGTLTIGDAQYDEEEITISLGGFLVFDGNAGHPINGSFIEVEDGGSCKINAGITVANNAVNNGVTGAGIYTKAGGSFELNGGTIKNNISKTNGAGLYAEGNVLIRTGHIDDNEAVNGAGIYVPNGGTLQFLDGELVRNEASADGAGLYVAGGSNVTINNIDINQNNADNNGAGIFVATSGELAILGGQVRNNRTINGNGSGMYVEGKATLTGGTILDNTISTFNENPLGKGIYLDGELHASHDIVVKEENPIYITSGDYIYLDDVLTTGYALPVITESMNVGTKVAKINTDDEENAKRIETNVLINKSIYEVTENKQIVPKIENNEYFLIYDSIEVVYDRNNATAGTVPVDTNEYSGGDTVIPKENVVGEELTRGSYVFLGWTTNQVPPISSAASELSNTIYYPTELIEGVIYTHSYSIFADTTFYAVWAIDANRNGVPDYRENVLNITIAPSVNGSTTSNINEAQGGTLVMLTTSAGDGYEVDTIEVKYTLNGIEGTLSLENGKVVKLTDTYYYFNMPLADATVYTTFKEQSIFEVKVLWDDNTEEEIGTLQEAISLINENLRVKGGKKITVLKYIYSPIEVHIPEGLNIELDLAGYTLDMNHLDFAIAENAQLKITDSLTGGRIIFDTSGGSNGISNNLVNNGTLNIAGGIISIDDGDTATEKLIENNGTLTISAGTIKHNADNGIAIYNNGKLSVGGGNINGKKYGIYQANIEENSLELSGLGTEETYGVNNANYLSSIYLKKNTFVDISNVLGNCSSDNVVANGNKIPLYLDDTIGTNESIIKSSRMAYMVKHFRTHFDLENRPTQEIVVNANNEAILIEKPGVVVTEAENATYPYRTNVKLIANLYDTDNNPYIGFEGTAYFFLFDQMQAWHNMYDPNAHEFRQKDPTDPNSEYYGFNDAVGSGAVDSSTGIAECTFLNETLTLDKSYYIFVLVVGEGIYDTYSSNGNDSFGYKGPIRIKNEDQGTFKITKKDINDSSITINCTTEKQYNGQEQDVVVEVFDGDHRLTIDEDYTVTRPGSLIDAGTYNIVVTGIGKYENQVTKEFRIKKYNDAITIDGVALMYNFTGSAPDISFGGTNPTATVKDNRNVVLVYGTDYSVKYQKLNSTTDLYEDLAEIPSAVGIYKVVATVLNSSTNYEEGLIAEAAFIISDEGSQYDVTFANNTLTYNGEERAISELGTIIVKRRASEGVDEIVLNSSDYTARFGTSNVKNAGTYSVIIQGHGTYENVSLAETITIVPKAIDSTNTTVTFAESEYYYTGRTRVPEITNIEVDGVNTDGNNGGTPLVLDTDYITSVQGDSINIGNPTFRLIALNGNYTGSIEYPYEIKPRDITNNDNITISIYQTGFSGSEVKPTVTVMDSVGGASRILVETVDYTVSYRAKESANDGASISQNGYPINKGTYEAVITGINNYTGEKIATFVIGNYKGRIIATLDPNVYTYAGNASVLEGSIKKALTVTRGTDGAELEYGVDYILGFNTPENTEAPSEVGDYLLYVVGIGNYDEVQTTTTYTVSPLTGTIYLELESDTLVFNGSNQFPPINKNASYLLLDGSKVYLSSLEENTDYAVITSDNSKDIGGYTLQVNGIGRYAGNYNFANYQIVSKDLTDADIVINSVGPVSRVYNGEAQELEFNPSGDAWIEYRVSETSVIVLEEGTDFDVIYNNNTESGTAVAVIVGKGNYSKANSFVYSIEKRNIGNGTIADGYTVNQAENKAYTGSACIQSFTLVDTELNRTLTSGTDYEVTYEDNINVGTASYVITGKGNYVGTINGNFDIQINHTISIIANEEFEYTGEPINDLITVTDSLNHVLSQSEYELTYYKDSNCTEVTTTEEGASGDGKVPANSGTYYRKVVGTSTNHNGLTATSEFTIKEPKGKTINMTFGQTTFNYDGDVHSATIELKDINGDQISSGDYTITYYKDEGFTNTTDADDGVATNGGAPANAGVYYIRIVGLNDYSDFDSYITFTISKRRIQDMDIEMVNDSVYTGSPITPKPEVSWMKDSTKITLVENVDIEYEYSNNTNVGEATINIKPTSTSRNYEGTATIKFSILGSSNLDVRLENSQVVYNGEVQKPSKAEIYVGEKSIEQLEAEGNQYDIDYGTGNYKDAGRYEIEVSTSNEEKSVTYTITEKDLVVTPKANQSKIYGEKDTELKFTTNINTESGLYSTDTFDGDISRAIGEDVGEYAISLNTLSANNYLITLSGDIKYMINPKDVEDSEVTITGIEDNYSYTGTAIKPNAIMTYNSELFGKLALEVGEDFEIEYQYYDIRSASFVDSSDDNDLVAVGRYKAVISGINNYTGTIEQEYNITSGLTNFSAKVTGNNKIYNKQVQGATIQVKSGTSILKENVDYTVSYYIDDAFNTKTSARSGGAETTGGAPRNAGTYYIKIEGTGNFEGNSSNSTMIITPKPISDREIQLSKIDSQSYTGTLVEPEVVLTWENPLVRNRDFQVIYSNNLNVGTASVTIIGIGNYNGARSTTFNIGTVKVKLTLKLYEQGELVSGDTYTYDGTPKMPTAKVFRGTKELDEGKDFVVNYLNNVNVGTARVTTEFRGNYSGRLVGEFIINKFDLKDADITLSSDAIYNGREQKPTVQVKRDSVLLRENSDYEVIYSGDFKDAGTYDVIIRAEESGNYKGEVTKTFKIDKYGKVENEVLLLEFANGKASYKEDVTKEAFEQNLQVKDMFGNVLEASEYDVSYSSDGTTFVDEFPDTYGVYVVKVTGKGNNYASQNDVATRDFVIYVHEVIANDIERDYRNSVYTISDISGDLTIESDLGVTLDNSKFDISFGRSTPKEVGTYTIVISGKLGDSYEGLLGTSEFSIKPVSEISVQDIDNLPYTGTTSKPEIVVLGIDGTTLTQGKDYLVTYTGTDVEGNDYESNNPPTNVGDYEAVVTGIGNYAGSQVTKGFSIERISSGDIDAVLSQTEFTFNEMNQVPVEIVKYVTTEHTILLVSGDDYDISYMVSGDTIIEKADIIEVGEYTAVISLKGNYSGTINLDFSIIEPASSGLNISIRDNSKEYNMEPQEIEIVVKDVDENELVEDVDYKITYYKDSSFTTLTDSEDGAVEEGTAPANSGKYYVLIEGLDDYSDNVSDAIFVITKKSINDLSIEDIENQLYDGEAKEPLVTIKDGATEISSSEYSITYKNNIEMGNDTASATITMNDDSNYTGSKVIYFSIIMNPDEDIEITLVDEKGNEVNADTYTYDANEKKPEAIVKQGGRELEEGKDYTVSYKNNKSVGTATATVTLKGDYSGTVSKTFTINPLDLENCTVSARPQSLGYTGKDIFPKVEVTYETEEGKFIKIDSSDYDVVYPEKSRDAGEYTVTVNAKSNNLVGTTQGTYKIIRASSGGTKIERITKEVVKTEVVYATPSGEEDNSLLDKVNHNSYIKGYDDGTFKPDKVMTRAEVVTIFTRLLKKMPSEDEVKVNPFTDIDDHWAKDAILIMSSLGIVKGYDDGSFCPENKITRAEFATMISRFEKVQKLDMNTNFYDVTEDHWAYDTINYARYMGWISGYDDGSFKPNNPITRAEAITIVNRILGRAGDVTKINSNRYYNIFTDIDGHWAYYGIIEATNKHDYEVVDNVEIWK